MKVISPKYLFLFILVITGYKTQAQNLAWQTTTRQSKPFVFMQNKGQLADEKGNVLTDIQYYASQNGVNIYCKKDRIAFVFTKVETSSPVDPHCNASLPTKPPLPAIASAMVGARMEMQFLNANPDVQSVSEMPDAYYENYYLAHCPEGITANGFKKLTYKNIWPQIDLVLQTNSGQKQGLPSSAKAMAGNVEYSFVVYPGGNVKDIQIQWNGAESINADGENKGITYANSLGRISESGLKSYLDGTNLLVGSLYQRNNDRLGFKVDRYDKNDTLVIDPTLEWATYLGAPSGEEDGYFIRTDPSGNIYVSGETRSNVGFATKNAFDTTGYNTGMGMLCKYTSAGMLEWATYYFGDRGAALTIDGSGYIYITGSTYKKNGVATSGAFSSKLTSLYGDAYLAKFNSDGKRIWGTYLSVFGGNSSSGIATDDFGNVYVTGNSYYNTKMGTSGTYKSVADSNDVFLVKFNSSGSFTWGTYFGGTDIEEAGNVFADAYGNIFISGITQSAKAIASNGAYQTVISGVRDAFLAKFSSSGALKWSTYFGGPGSDIPHGLHGDANGDIYLCGATNSTQNIASTGAYQSKIYGNQGYEDGFLVKFGTGGNRIWSTYYGGDNEDIAYGVATDANSNVYITGGTNSYNNIASPGSYMTALPDYNSIFWAKFTSGGKRLCASYYGGNVLETGFDLTAIENENILITGMTKSTSGIATSGAYQTTAEKASLGDAFVIKFDTRNNHDAGIVKVIPSGDFFCEGSQIIKVNLKNFGSLDLDSVKIWYSINGVLQPAYSWKNNLAPDKTTIVALGANLFKPGANIIKAWTTLPDGFVDSIPENDTAYIIDTVYETPKANTGGNNSFCPGNPITIGDTTIAGHTYLWTSKPPGFTSTLSNPVITPKVQTVYYLTEKITSTGCSKSDSALIVRDHAPYADMGGDKTICAGDKIFIGPGDQYQTVFDWSSEPMDSNYSPNLGFGSVKVSPKVTTTYYVTARFYIGGSCKVKDSATITVIPKPKGFNVHDTGICEESRFQIGTSTLPGYSYSWSSKPAGFSSTLSNPIMEIKAPSVIYFTQKNDLSGCAFSDSISLKISPLPVPHAGKKQSVCPGSKIYLGDSNFVSKDDYIWASVPPGYSSTLPQPIDTPKFVTKYIVKETNPFTGCSAQDSVNIVVYPVPHPVISGKTKVCGNDIEPYSTAQNSDSKYLWTAIVANITSGKDSNFVKIKPGFGLNFLAIKETNAFGCSGTDEIHISVLKKPDAYFKILSDSPVYQFKAISATANNYSWNFGDGKTGNRDTISHNYTFEKDSLVKISLIVSDSFGCSSQYDSVVKIRYRAPEKFNIQVFPNPFSDQVHVKIDLEKASHIQIVVFDALGRLIDKIVDADQPIGKKTYTLNSNDHHIAAGVYFLRIIVDNTSFVRKVVKVE